MWDRHLEAIRGNAEKAILDEKMAREIPELPKDINA